jgi:hypothetical protein
MTRAVVVDVEGVVSPVHGHTAWGDDVVAGNVFGPVYTSPAMCRRLDELALVPGVSCWWLTSWTPQMRARMDPFPGRDWPVVADQPSVGSGPGRGRWWKPEALEAWLARHGDVTAIAWCDDHLRPGARAAAVRRRLASRGVDALLIAPDTAVGLTPDHLAALTAWAHGAGTPAPVPKVKAAG